MNLLSDHHFSLSCHVWRSKKSCCENLAMSALFIATVGTDDHCDQSIESNEQQHQTTVFLRTSGTIRIVKKNLPSRVC